jgi:uncharacterized membrane protein YgcG
MALFGMQPLANAQFAPAYSNGQPGQYAAPDSQAYPEQYPPPQPAPGYPPQGGAYPPPQYPGAAPNPSTADEGADQQHGVARLSIVQGDVNVKRGDNGELVAAIVNAPLMTQDHVQTSPGSRAEVEFDYANLVRLAPNTDVGFADLEYHRYQIQLGAGTIIYRVLRNEDAQTEIDTPSIAFRPLGEGEYRLSVLDDGTTQITVRSGAGQIFGPRGSEQLQAGRSTLVRGNPSDPEFQSTYEIARDQFDDWSANRDRELLASQSYRYVSPDVYGAEDLDAYGKWVPSQYGQVWEPQAPTPDWAPYSYGQWDYEPYYGWTWVDYAPWGWAPYHYGRWFFNAGYGWCWWPGVFGARFLWSPALVGFFGFGAALGWVALAPFEAFFGWWGHWGHGFGFGVFHNVNIFSTYRNAAFRGGAVYAGYNGFGGPHQRFGFATREQLTNANAFRGQIPVNPSRGSYQLAARQASANPRLAAVSNRQFFHTNFANNRGATFANNRGITGFAGTNGARYTPQAQQAPRSNANTSGWSRFGDPGRTSAYRQNYSGASVPQARPGQESGWHTFGQAQPSRPANNGYTNGYQQSRPGAYSNYSAPRYSAPAQRYSAPAAPRYSAPAAPHYSAPSAPHYSAPSSHGGGGGGGRSSGGGGSHAGGGHSSGGGGHHGR